jgi:hypothetical protein
MNQKQLNLNIFCLFQLKQLERRMISDTDSFEIHGNLCISLNIIMEYSFSYLLWNENTCKTHKHNIKNNTSLRGGLSTLLLRLK